MTELFTPEERIAFTVWCHEHWGMEFPISGDTLAMLNRKAVLS